MAPGGGPRSFEQHPDFPRLPASVPLAYSLALKACLDPSPAERPTCPDLLRLLDDLAAEVAEGSYVNSKGLIQVRRCCWLSVDAPLRSLMSNGMWDGVSARMHGARACLREGWMACRTPQR